MLKENLAKAIAAFYNYIPKSLRITIFNSTSVFIATASTVLVGRLTNVQVQDPIIAAFIVLVIAIFSGIINELQSKLKELGDRELAREGDQKVLAVYQAKETAAQKIVQIAKKNQ